MDAFSETPVTETLVGPLGVLGVLELVPPDSVVPLLQAAIEKATGIARTIIPKNFPKNLNLPFIQIS